MADTQEPQCEPRREQANQMTQEIRVLIENGTILLAKCSLLADFSRRVCAEARLEPKHVEELATITARRLTNSCDGMWACVEQDEPEDRYSFEVDERMKAAYLRGLMEGLDEIKTMGRG